MANTVKVSTEMVSHIDRLGTIREQIKVLGEEEKALTAKLKEELPTGTTVMGNEFSVELTLKYTGVISPSLALKRLGIDTLLECVSVTKKNVQKFLTDADIDKLCLDSKASTTLNTKRLRRAR